MLFSNVKKVDNCARCANGDVNKTSCYGNECACNPSNKTCNPTGVNLINDDNTSKLNILRNIF